MDNNDVAEITYFQNAIYFFIWQIGEPASHTDWLKLDENGGAVAFSKS